MKYTISENLLLETANSFRATTWWGGNCPYDPDGGGSATVQPTGWDQWSTFYDRYYCSGSKINLEMVLETGVAANAGIVVGCFPSKEVFQASDFTSAKPGDYAYCTERQLNIMNGPRGYFVCRKYMATKKMFGMKTAYDQDFQGDAGTQGTGTNPDVAWWWNAYAYDPAATNDGTKIAVRITITYYIQFFGRKDLPIS